MRKDIVRRLNAAAAAAMAFTLSALLWMLLLALSGAACIVAGVHLLLGPAWAFLVAGLLLLLAAGFLGRGLNG